MFNAEAAQQVVDELGPDTFSQKALDLVSQDGTATIVPSDGWGQLLIYRKDLFKKAGIDDPATLEDVRAAAEKLDGGDMAGIVLATAPGDGFTAETFEHVALAKGCELVDDGGTVTIDSPECVDALTYYGDLASNFSVEGNQDVDSTRGTYFAGRAAMMFWSPFLLDGMAGLRADTKPSCPECKKNPAYLAENSGLVGPLSSEGGEPSQFGSVSGFAIGETEQRRRVEGRRRVPDDGRLRALARAVAAGQVPRPRRRRGGPGEVHRPRGPSSRAAWTPRRRCPSSTTRPRSTRSARGWTTSSAGPSRRGRARCSARWPASSRSRARWRPWWAAPTRPRSSPRPRRPSKRSRRAWSRRARWRPPPPLRRSWSRTRRSAGARRLTRAQRDARAGLAMVSPTFVVIVVMVILPVIWALILSFERIRLIQLQSVDLLTGPYTLRNYELLLGSDDFWSALLTTLQYSVFGTTGAIVLGLIAALLVRRPFRGRGPRARGDAAAVGGARGGHHVRVDRAAVAAARAASTRSARTCWAGTRRSPS